jgi:hypothetical protein
MIIIKAAIIRIEAGEHEFTRSGESPGVVTVTKKGHRPTSFNLPTNPEEAAEFVQAYMHAINENVAYRTSEVRPAHDFRIGG